MKLTSLIVLAFTCSAFAVDAPPSDVVLLDHGKVDAAFAKGQALLANSSYKIHAGRRVAASDVVEIHEHDTDIFYIQEGSGTLLTGGTAVDSKPTAPGEIRAKKIVGGTEHHLVKGDVIVIPATVPHQFTEISGTFLYFVVKVTR